LSHIKLHAQSLLDFLGFVCLSWWAKRSIFSYRNQFYDFRGRFLNRVQVENLQVPNLR
jgi:hypothetical protein